MMIDTVHQSVLVNPEVHSKAYPYEMLGGELDNGKDSSLCFSVYAG
jgi:hypothetical protein